MKLLLTSAGLTNEALRSTFLNLTNKSADTIKVAFINTAAKAETDKEYVTRDLENLRKTGVKDITLVDISLSSQTWRNILQNANVIWVEGGNTFYLLDELRKSGLDQSLRETVRDKVYVGVSAGSIIVTPTIAIAAVEPGDSNEVAMTDFTGLKWVRFEVSPHTPDIVSIENVERYSKSTENTLYAYDDESAVLVVDNAVEIIGNGFSKKFN